jgi:hypothetical protein
MEAQPKARRVRVRTPELRARERARYARVSAELAAKRAARPADVRDPDSVTLKHLARARALTARLALHFEGHDRAARCRGEVVAARAEFDFSGPGYVTAGPGGSALPWRDALITAAGDLTQGAPVPLAGLRDCFSRIATALALEGVRVSDGLVNTYAVWVVEALGIPVG